MPRQVVDLALVVHAHLDHQRFVRGLEREHRERQADVVVQVARRAAHAPARRPRASRAHSSLVVVLPFEPVIATTGPAKRARWPRASSPSARTVSADHDRRHARTAPRSSRDQQRRRAARDRVAARSRGRRRSRRAPRRTARRAPSARVSVETPSIATLRPRRESSPPQQLRELAEPSSSCGAPRARAARARASSRSSKWTLLAADDLVVLVALAGDHDAVAGRAPARSRARSRCAGRAITSCAPDRPDRDVAQDRVGVLACAGCRW